MPHVLGELRLRISEPCAIPADSSITSILLSQGLIFPSHSRHPGVSFYARRQALVDEALQLRLVWSSGQRADPLAKHLPPTSSPKPGTHMSSSSTRTMVLIPRNFRGDLADSHGMQHNYFNATQFRTKKMRKGFGARMSAIVASSTGEHSSPRFPDEQRLGASMPGLP